MSDSSPFISLFLFCGCQLLKINNNNNKKTALFLKEEQGNYKWFFCSLCSFENQKTNKPRQPFDSVCILVNVPGSSLQYAVNSIEATSQRISHSNCHTRLILSLWIYHATLKSKAVVLC